MSVSGIASILIVGGILAAVHKVVEPRRLKRRFEQEERNLARRAQKRDLSGVPPIQSGAHPAPFGHRSAGSVFQDYRRGTPMLGQQLSSTDVIGSARYVHASVAPDSYGQPVVYRASRKAMLLAPVVSAALFALIIYGGQYLGGGEVAGVAGQQLLLAFLGYGVLLVWAFKAEIDGDMIRIRTPFFIMRSYDLNDLVRMHDDGPMYWRLVFNDGQRPQVLKMVAGADDLRHRLAAILEQRERG